MPVEIEPSSKIRNVVVFTESAMIKKEARFHVKKGENTARISGLTPYLVDQSIQVSIEGKSAVKISEVKVIENEMKDLRSSDKSIEISLISHDENKEINIVFSYVVNNAGWAPLYEVRADSNAAKINMNYFATIKQATGEDWTDVNIEISTAKPYTSKAPSDLTA